MSAHDAVDDRKRRDQDARTHRVAILDGTKPATSWIQWRGPLPLMMPMPPGDERPGRPLEEDQVSLPVSRSRRSRAPAG